MPTCRCWTRRFPTMRASPSNISCRKAPSASCPRERTASRQQRTAPVCTCRSVADRSQPDIYADLPGDRGLHGGCASQHMHAGQRSDAALVQLAGSHPRTAPPLLLDEAVPRDFNLYHLSAPKKWPAAARERPACRGTAKGESFTSARSCRRCA
jgi:hypothetical protein